jgi:hypothetical protein
MSSASHSMTSLNSDLHSLFYVIKENIRLYVSTSTSEIFDRFTRNMVKNNNDAEGQTKTTFLNCL